MLLNGMKITRWVDSCPAISLSDNTYTHHIKYHNDYNVITTVHESKGVYVVTKVHPSIWRKIRKSVANPFEENIRQLETFKK